MTDRQRFWNAGRSRRIAIAVLLAVGLGAVAGYSVTTAGDSAVQRGDFPVFHAVGRLIVAGAARSIYDLQALQKQQAADWPQLGSDFFPFAYPAFYAALLAPLGLLAPLAAKGVFSAGMLCCALAALLIGVRLAPGSTRRWPEAAALTCALVPLVLSIVGGQNTALSLLLLIAAVAALQRGDHRGDIAAGALLGLWLFKPHFALVAIGLALAARRWRVLLGALPVALALYLVGWLLLGGDWVGPWIAALAKYANRDYVANQHQMVCLVGAAHVLASALALPPAGARVLIGIAWAISIALVALCALWLWRSSGQSGGDGAATKAGTGKANLAAEGKPSARCAPFALVGPLIVLTSPHTVIYDLPLALLPALLVAHFDRDREVHGVVLVWIAVAACTLLKDALPVSPLLLISVAALIFVYLRGQEPGPAGKKITAAVSR